MFGKSVNTDYLISLLLSVIDDTREMDQLYAELLPILEREVALIRSSQYEDLQSVVEQKVEHSQKIEATFDRMSDVSRKITFLHRENFFDTARNADSLTATLAMFEDFQEPLQGKNMLVEQTFEHNLAKFRQAITSLQNTKEAIKPKMEFNRVVTTEISKNYQLSMRFWEELSQESTSSYTAQGTRQSVSGLSTIIAKA